MGQGKLADGEAYMTLVEGKRVQEAELIWDRLIPQCECDKAIANQKRSSEQRIPINRVPTEKKWPAQPAYPSPEATWEEHGFG